ncbi:hypothetical protein ODJ79_15735 [Actinoplanes sp. KI2]|uniref:hypothetical protein n=1 Tax=Actinoplanes sp. KI2 TaxID=2983315 RepID=UPI0021D5D3B7|nr:hypothetical protein [Actinoplanes sp. KI2]MCU7725179.1 hypothetical protein [Actinoplanes sp. KI2]
MRYMANSRIADGVSRAELVQFFAENTFSPASWDLVRRRTVIEYAMKEGDIPGVLLFLEADSAEQAAAIVNELHVVKRGLLAFDIDPLGKTMHLQLDG